MHSQDRTIAQAVQGRLKLDILFGRLVPDHRLRLERLRDSYQVGMSPLREALANLVGNGLVIQEGQRGFRVAPVSRAEFIDITQTRVRMESMALRDAIERGDDGWEARILAARHRLARHQRTAARLVDETWEALHRAFHLALIDACGSACLLDFCHRLHDQFDRYRRLAVLAGGRHPRITNLHDDIVAAVLDRNKTRACALLEKHIAESAAEVLRMNAARFGEAVTNDGMRIAKSVTRKTTASRRGAEDGPKRPKPKGRKR